MKRLLVIILTLFSLHSFAQDTTYVKVRGIPGAYNFSKSGDSLIFYVAGVRHALSVGSTVDLSNYYNKTQVDNSLNGKVDTSYKQSITAIKPLHWNVITPDSATIGLYVDTTSTLSDGSDSSLVSSLAVKKYVDKTITPNMFKGLGLSDNQKIQAALNLSVSKHKKLVIPFNEERGSNIWLLDSAILLKSNSYITIENATLKLSDSSRDNVFRTANAGIGISNPQDNPLQNITIEGVGNAIIEGADNPRATGDAGKTLTLTGDLFTDVSYGTDAGKSERSQVGDWRNIGLLFAYTSNIKISGLTLHNLHAWATSFERCSYITVRDIILDHGEKRPYADYVKNTDGFDFRNGCHDFIVENINGTTGDDAVALTSLQNFSSTGAGVIPSYMVTSMVADTTVDNIYNFTIKNIKSKTYHNIVRLLNTGGVRIYNGTISDVKDITINDSLVRKPTGSVVVLGSATGSYGGPTPLGNIRNINISNVTSKNYPYTINIQGSIAESSITNIIKDSSSNPAIYFHPSSFGARNLTVSNIFDSTSTDLAAIRSGTGAVKSGLIRSAGALIITDSAQTGLKYAADYSGNFSSRSLVDKGYVEASYYIKSAVDALLAQKAGLTTNTFTGAQTVNDGLGTTTVNGTGVVSNRISTYYGTSAAGGTNNFRGDFSYFMSSNTSTVYGYIGALEAKFFVPVKTTQYNLTSLNTAPASATATGTLGEIRITSGFIYVCTATNTWVRAALTTW